MPRNLSRPSRSPVAAGVLAMLASLLALVPTAASTVAGAPASAAGVDLTCSLALTKTDPDTINVAYPDEAANYYGVVFANVPGLRLRITGRYPHARYMSYNTYDHLLRPTDAVADVEITPDAGHRNPFEPGARRGVRKRDYTVFVDLGALPEDPADRAPNTIYAGTAQDGTPLPGAGLLYRIYTPDAGRTEYGDVPLPTVTLETTSGTGPLTESLCDEVTKPRTSLVTDLTQASNALPGPLDDVLPFGRPTPRWLKFYNLPTAVADNALDNPTLGPLRPGIDPLVAAFGEGGFLSNIHNSYVYASTNRRYGDVLVTRFKVPTYADTRDGARRMPRGTQLRFWSICQEEFFSQRYVACKQDDQVVTRRGWATIVVSTPEQRPATAVRRCGVTWMPWGPVPEGVLLLRHMLPDAGFDQTVAEATYQQERRTMGRYLPRSRYFDDAAAYEAAGPRKTGARCR